ncbi:DUF4870 family protein [Marinobacter sp. ANT_B65]|uniref:DUF4870 family protein n=1 Tax=Marinobacter sp. ANT_B65 TaxID=2039467 RepID=UPI000BBEE954|nr:hypothetical protein [Marinobacter sp. ANT_B65]PCM45737.1 hypothetical protein CPA50_07115 [Marinobacter sp. ANT_B65]
MSSSESISLSSEKNTVWLVYILHVLGFFTGGLTSIAAIIVNYVKMSDMKSSVAKSHFKWQIRTFWWGLLWSLISLVLTYFLVGLLGFVVLFFWFVYRLVMGMIKLNDNKGMYGVV